MRVWGECLEGDTFLEVEHVELDLAGGVALAQGVHHHRGEVGLALPNCAGDQGVVALVELVAEGDLDGGHPIGAHCEADAIPTGLRPGGIQRLHLAEGHWLHLRRRDGRRHTATDRDQLISAQRGEAAPYATAFVKNRASVDLALLAQAKNKLVDPQRHGVDEEGDASGGASLEQDGQLVLDLIAKRLIAASGADPLGTGQFWAAYEALSEAQRQQWVGPVLTRLQPFLIRPHLRATLGQAAPSFDLGEVFTRRRIVLVSLNKGVLGAESARLLGSLLVGQLWPLILARAAVEPSRRHVVSVFIDEVQDYLSLPGSLADALAQARSLGAAFHLAHQYRGQLPAALKAGIDANARNKIIFSLSAADAAELARQAIGLEAADFQLLPRFGVYARTMHHGRENPWCHATTLPPTPPVQDALALRAASQARYGQDAAQVEAALLARLRQHGEMTGDDVAQMATDDATGELGGEATNDGTGPANGVPGSTADVVFGRRPGRDGGTA